MPRSVWTGALSFGLVTIPVRLYPATEPKDVRFHMVDERGRRVRYRRFVEDEEPATWSSTADDVGLEDTPPPTDPPEPASPGDEREVAPSGAPPDGPREVAYGDLRRGYETDGGMVVLDRDEIESFRPERSRVIEIEDFVDIEDVDPVFFEKSYVLAPQPGSEKPYALLLHALERAGRVGIGRFVLRTKPHLVAIRPAEGALGLETLFFGDEVRDPRSLVPGIDAIEVAERELELAERLIGMLETAWNPAAYADTYREELLRKIAEKAPEPIPEQEVASTPSGDRVDALMEALKASVEQAKERSGATRKARSSRRTA